MVPEATITVQICLYAAKGGTPVLLRSLRTLTYDPRSDDTVMAAESRNLGRNPSLGLAERKAALLIL